MFYYWLLGAGLPLVLFCLFFCLHRQCKKEFFCLHRQCKKESGPILKKSTSSTSSHCGFCKDLLTLDVEYLSKLLDSLSDFIG
jgi:transcription elongation factor Elf1